MTLYALHYQWIGASLRPTPVGIWGEGGSHFYPAEMKSYTRDSWGEAICAPETVWVQWVNENVEYHSRDGSSLRAIESADSLTNVLVDVQSKFFNSIEPAQRFVLAQSWWIGAELVRRHPELILHESHPGGGQYDVLAAFTLPYDNALMHVMLNRVGTMQVHILDGRNGPPEVTEIGTWSEALSAQNSHDVVKRIERIAQLSTKKKAPASTPRALAYRFIATLLAATANDRHAWDARNDFIDSSGDDWCPGDPEVHGFTDGFPKVREDFASTPKIGLWEEPNSHFWAILRDEIPVAIVSIEGRVYGTESRYDLSDAYAANGRRMLPLVTSILGDLLT